MIDIENIPLDDQDTWNLISSGKTCGVFQLEKSGRTWSKILKPKNIDELSDLIAIIRPGCKDAEMDGKSLTQHYADRKNGKDETVFFHPSLEPILKETYGILCIHEDSLVSMANWTRKKIKDVIPGDKIFSVNQKSHELEKDICHDICISPKTSGIQITLSNGHSVIVTHDHKVRTIDGWIKAENLKIRDLIQYVCNDSTEILYTGVSELKEVHDKIFYSISVENNHNLICNWIVVKNCYQEQTIRIAMELAGFTEEESDSLRKIIGKKMVDKMLEMREKFIDGCVKKGVVNKETATEIFNWIEASSRYGFNKCIHRDTEVEVFENTRGDLSKKKKVCDVKVGEYVTSPFGALEVLNVYDNGEKECYEYMFSSGSKIVCTKDHKFATVKELGVIDQVLPIGEISEKGLWVYSNGRAERVVASKLIGLAPTFDLEVNHPLHLFFAQDLLVSNSHSVCYAVDAYWSAYCKTHYPLKFYQRYLSNAGNKPDKMEEIKNLVRDAKYFNIEVYPPRLSHFYDDFTIDENKDAIYYGCGHVKDVGVAGSKVMEVLEDYCKNNNKEIKSLTWKEIIVNITDLLNKKVVEALISVGAFNGINNKLTRNLMLFEYKAWSSLTDKEKKYIKSIANKGLSLSDNIEQILINNACTKGRVQTLLSLHATLNNPPRSLADDAGWMAKIEEDYLGVALTCSQVDDEDLSAHVTHYCMDIVKQNTGPTGGACIAVKINRIKEWKTKNDNLMCFVSAEDSSGELDSIAIFSDKYEELKPLIYEGNTLLLYGEIKLRQSSLSFIVNNAKQI